MTTEEFVKIANKQLYRLDAEMEITIQQNENRARMAYENSDSPWRTIKKSAYEIIIDGLNNITGTAKDDATWDIIVNIFDAAMERIPRKYWDGR